MAAVRKVERTQQILKDLLRGKAMRTEELCERFGAQPRTIRADLSDLRDFWKIEQIQVGRFRYWAMTQEARDRWRGR